MFLKRIYLLIIVAAIYMAVMVEHPSPVLKDLGYRQVLNCYGKVCARRVEITILSQPGLRVLKDLHSDRIVAVIPGGDTDYPRQLSGFLEQGCQAVVECSALDAWHTTASGQIYLQKMRYDTYRVVVFDGGHHLPTLGLAPDIIIMPLTHGYAAHASTVDGIRAKVVADLAREAGCPAGIACVPRWGLVKAAPSLSRITARIIAESPVSGSQTPFMPRACREVSIYGGLCFAYIDREYVQNQTILIRQLDKLNANSIHKICLAFDYRYTDITSADEYCRALSRRCQVPVVRVNEPVKVASAILPWRVGKDELPQSGYNTENH